MAQNKSEIEIKVESSVEVVRGGEKFSYSFKVRNTSAETAKDLVLATDIDSSLTFVSAYVSQGTYEHDNKSPTIDLRIYFGDISGYGEAVGTIETKVNDWGDISSSGNSDKGFDVVDRLPSADLSKPDSKKAWDVNRDGISLSIYYPWLSCENCSQSENDLPALTVKVLPSKNIPPRVEILSPKNEGVITRPAKKLTKVIFTIKAFDLDGTIEKVQVNTQQFGISVEYPENRIVIEGKSYSIKEVEENMNRFQKYFGGNATKIGKDTYSFILENPNYGFNNVFVTATDNENRDSSASLRFTVKGDNSIEFARPLKDTIIQPNSDVIIETTSKLNEGSVKELLLIGNQVCCDANKTQMKQISKIGNIYRHQYLWKNISKGYYNLQVILAEDSGAFTYSDSLQFKVTEKPQVRITSLKAGQVFAWGKDIDIELDSIDPDGEIKDTTIFVNGTYSKDFEWGRGGINKKGYISNLRRGTYVIYAQVTDDMDVKAKSELVTIMVK